MKRFSTVSIIIIALWLISCAPQSPRAVTPPPYPSPKTFVYRLPQIAAPRPITPIRTEKKGAGLSYYEFANDASRIGAAWCYNWSNGSHCGDDASIEFVPMVWCIAIPNALPFGTEWLLSANEPDRADQCNISPGDYAITYRDIETRYPNVKLVAPSISQYGFEWLEQFRAAYIARYGHAPRMDALAIHCYATIAVGCTDIINRAIMLADAWDIAGGVWVTEVALFPCAEDINTLNESRTLLDWLEDNPRVARYAWWVTRIRGNEWWWTLPNECKTALFDFETERYTPFGEMYAVQ